MSSPSNGPPLRIGTSERESAYAALNAHLDAGRLDVDEYGERYAKASLARTRPEIEALFTDLPAPHPVLDEPRAEPSWVSGPPPRRRHRLAPAAFALIPLVAIVVAISTGFWFLFFLIPLGASMFGRAFGRGRYGYRGYRGRGYC